MPDGGQWLDSLSAAQELPGNPLRIGYFGGTFDPPHRGHLAVARAARDRFALDHVLLAPTGRQPLKRTGPVAPWADRLRMTELLCADEPGLEASAIDGPQPEGEPNYTVDTLRRLQQELSAFADRGPVRLFGILGADAFLGLPHWREPYELFRLAEWIVVSRPGFPLPAMADLDLSPAQIARIHGLPELHDPVTATELRSRLRAGADCGELIPAPVYAYLQQQGLYRNAG